MPKGAMSLEEFPVQWEMMERKLEESQKEAESSKKEAESLKAANNALMLTMQQLMQKAHEDQAELQARLEQQYSEQISQLKHTVESLSTAQVQDCEQRCDSVSVDSDAFSKATSKITMFSTDHMHKRLNKHNMSRHDVQKVIKHGGEGTLQDNGRRRVSYDGKSVILAGDSPVVVTTFHDGPAPVADSCLASEEQDGWAQVEKGSKRPIQKIEPVMLGSSTLARNSAIHKLKNFTQEHENLNGNPREMLVDLEGLAVRMSQDDVDQLVKPVYGKPRNINDVVTSRIKDALHSIAGAWKGHEVEEYIRVHRIRHDPAAKLRCLPEGKREEKMHALDFFRVRDKSAFLMCALS